MFERRKVQLSWWISDVEDLKDASVKTTLTIHGLLKDKAGEKFMNALRL
jgi:hypothetical protein